MWRYISAEEFAAKSASLIVAQKNKEWSTGVGTLGGCSGRNYGVFKSPSGS